jgi:hypothetical protein
MKTSVKSVLFALGAAGLSAAMTLPTSAQVFKGRGCDNVSTSRDKTPKPDSRCMHAAPDKYREQQNQYQQFMKANPPSGIVNGPNGSKIYEGVDKKGISYRIVHGGGGAWAGAGSAPSGSTGSGGSRGGTKPK